MFMLCPFSYCLFPSYLYPTLITLFLLHEHVWYDMHRCPCHGPSVPLSPSFFSFDKLWWILHRSHIYFAVCKNDRNAPTKFLEVAGPLNTIIVWFFKVFCPWGSWNKGQVWSFVEQLKLVKVSRKRVEKLFLNKLWQEKWNGAIESKVYWESGFSKSHENG